MGRLYNLFIGGIDTTAALDIFQITAAAGIPVALHGFELYCSSEIGDAQDELISVSLLRGSSGTTSGSGGFTPTTGSVPLYRADSSASFSYLNRNSTQMSGGTITTLRSFVWDLRVMLVKHWTPETRPIIAPSERLVLRMNSAPADAQSFEGTIFVEELA